jgi:hypothetical protein
MLVHSTKYFHIHRKFASISQIFNLIIYVLFVEVLNTLLCSNKYMVHNFHYH